MRPRLFTARNFALLFAAVAILAGMAYWIKSGMPLPGMGVPSTADRIAFISNRGGRDDLWMMRADGSDPIDLAQNASPENAPAWSADGTILAFISAAVNGENPQVREIDARPHAHPATLTQTSSAKSAPVFGPENRVFYLAAGTLVSTTSDGSDSDKIFPTFDETRALQGNDETPGILSMGGISSAILSPDGNNLAISIKTEHGEALLLYSIRDVTCALIAVGEHTTPAYLPDGRLIVLLDKGLPLRQPTGLFNADSVKQGAVVPISVIDQGTPEGATALIFFDAAGTPQRGMQLPFAPRSFAVSPDGTQAAFAFAATPPGSKQSLTGVSILPLESGAAAHRLYNEPASHCSWSPDGKQVAFVSGNDIYAAPADGSTPPKNLTNGAGRNAVPVWSPTKRAQ